MFVENFREAKGCHVFLPEKSLPLQKRMLSHSVTTPLCGVTRNCRFPGEKRRSLDGDIFAHTASLKLGSGTQFPFHRVFRDLS
jgi:hypothetical protein